MCSLLQLINSSHFQLSSLDQRVWLSDPKGFSCRYFFPSLVDRPEISDFDSFQFIWKSCVPYRIKVFSWLVVLGKLNTCDLVQKRNHHRVLSPSWCVLCRGSDESIDHLLLHCPLAARSVWQKLLLEIGLSRVFPAHCSLV